MGCLIFIRLRHSPDLNTVSQKWTSLGPNIIGPNKNYIMILMWSYNNGNKTVTNLVRYIVVKCNCTFQVSNKTCRKGRYTVIIIISLRTALIAQDCRDIAKLGLSPKKTLTWLLVQQLGLLWSLEVSTFKFCEFMRYRGCLIYFLFLCIRWLKFDMYEMSVVGKVCFGSFFFKITSLVQLPRNSFRKLSHTSWTRNMNSHHCHSEVNIGLSNTSWTRPVVTDKWL